MPAHSDVQWVSRTEIGSASFATNKKYNQSIFQENNNMGPIYFCHCHQTNNSVLDKIWCLPSRPWSNMNGSNASSNTKEKTWWGLGKSCEVL